MLLCTSRCMYSVKLEFFSGYKLRNGIGGSCGTLVLYSTSILFSIAAAPTHKEYNFFFPITLQKRMDRDLFIAWMLVLEMTIIKWCWLGTASFADCYLLPLACSWNGADQHEWKKNPFAVVSTPPSMQVPNTQEKIENQIHLAFVIYLELLESWNWVSQENTNNKLPWTYPRGILHLY